MVDHRSATRFVACLEGAAALGERMPDLLPLHLLWKHLPEPLEQLGIPILQIIFIPLASTTFLCLPAERFVVGIAQTIEPVYEKLRELSALRDNGFSAFKFLAAENRELLGRERIEFWLLIRRRDSSIGGSDGLRFYMHFAQNVTEPRNEHAILLLPVCGTGVFGPKFAHQYENRLR